ncbi:hypothetical protein BDF20DRAFT_832365 [Mycotypha africana]|uniref:uncharacterized protein n=1 Tax=Mycotypha africana TaxID=64632 RepID=UPI0023009A8B|nr:uncharacterized protein BDF20DRAFT_832365 [Mycotypha africana]KAI8987427.1 hypothetical protein BDF20DRAFT_832365 [Mycotypha africana]
MLMISEPKRRLIDAHVHFWHPDRVYIPWVKNSKLNKHKDAIEYSAQIKNAKVESAIYVETDVDPYYGLVEADWITRYSEEELEKTDSFGGIGGIVAFAPVHQGRHVEGYLRTLIRLTRNKLKGVRYLIQDPAQDPNRVVQPDFIEGVQKLASFDLSFDLAINCRECPAQFPPLLELVAQCPRVQFVLDHMGKPPCDNQPGEARFEFWEQHLLKLSQFPNVSCKVSGLITELIEHDDRTQDEVIQQLRPFIQVALKGFGIDRLLFGGDWPVCELAKNNLRWPNWFEIVSEIVRDWSEADKDKFFFLNASRVYKLTL